MSGVKAGNGVRAPEGAVRLMLNIDAGLHRRLQFLALKQNTTMRAIIIKALFKAGVK